MQLSGFKKVLNYTKKVMEDVKYRMSVSREEVIYPLTMEIIVTVSYKE